MEIKGIKYIAPCLDNSGYAQAARGNILALNSLGVPITVNPISFEKARPDLGKNGEILRGLINKSIEYNIVFIHTTPEFWKKYRESDKVNVGYTIWETDRLHPKWPEYINDSVSKVLVGCTWNKQIFKDNGITVPIGVVPHGIDIKEFDDIKPYKIDGVADDAFVFYSIFQWCYDDKTRVLTRNGFKYFKDLTYEDEIATLNKDTDELEYHNPDEIVNFYRKDKMLHLTGAQFDLCVNPEHKMVVKKHMKGSYKADPESSWELKPLNEMVMTNKNGDLKVSSKYRTKKDCIWNGKSEEVFLLEESNKFKEIKMDDFLEFLGWYLSKGFLEKSDDYYGIVIMQTKNEEYRKEIWDCINRMGFAPIDRDKDILFNSKYMYHYLMGLGKCYEKFIPNQFKELCSHQLMTLLTSLFKGNGSFNKNGEWHKYITTSKKLAEDVQECLLKVGMSGTVSASNPQNKKTEKIGRIVQDERLQYAIFVNRENNEPSMYYADLKEIDYDGYIYCARVKNHTMLVERNGKILFCGNTERKHPLALIKAYWYAFQNDENVALVLKTYRSDYSEREKDAIRNTLKHIKRVTVFDKYPKIYLILNMLTNDEILGLHARGDCYVSLDRGEGFGLCVSGDTKIITNDTVKSADRIVVGDEVLSKDGNFHKVIKTSKRYVDTALNISIKLHEDIVVSKEHPFYVSKNLTRWKRHNYNSVDVESELYWEEASNIEIGDYVAIPKPKLCDALVEEVDLSTFIRNNDIIVEDDTLSMKYGYSPKNETFSYKYLVDTYGFSKKIFELAVGHIKNGTLPKINTKVESAYNLLINIGYEIKASNKVNRFITVNDDVLNLFGWYIAEGNTNNLNFLEIDLHKNELHVAEMLSETFKKYFGVSDDSISVETKDNKSRLIVSNRIISAFFEENFGKDAYNKHVPEWLMRSSKYLIPLVRGLFKGAGYDSGSVYKLTTVSYVLAYQVKLILNALNVCPTMDNKGTDESGNYNRYVISVANAAYDKLVDKKINRGYKNHSIETDNYFLVKVTDIKEIDFNDYMYDFTVEDSESFVGNGILLHNCPFTAGACGNPIIVTGFGGVTEYAKEDNSYLVNYVRTPVWGMPWSPWYRGDQLWAEPDIEHGAQLLKHVYNNQIEAKQKGAILQGYLAENFSWEVIGKKIVENLEGIIV